MSSIGTGTDRWRKDYSMKYSDAGVDIDRADESLSGVRNMIQTTFHQWMTGGIGAFGGAVRVPDGYKRPVLVSTIDGVGTKLLVARRAGVYDTVGQDLVNHSVNDILTQFASPLYFLDYIGACSIDSGEMTAIVSGLVTACKAAGCALAGGETAEMPGVYAPGDFDLVGMMTGVVEEEDRCTGETIEPGDILVALPSSGLHTNGYSLVRMLFFEKLKLDIDSWVDEFSGTVGNELLKIHKSYLPAVSGLSEGCRGFVNGVAHITGGGMTDNLPRILPAGTAARIDLACLPEMPVFRYIMERGRVGREEMLRTFNMGAGMILAVGSDGVDKVMAELKQLDEEPFLLGGVEKDDGKGVKIRYTGGK